MQKFPHVDEAIVYSTYFEQANMDVKMATQLIQSQFPLDPAFDLQNQNQQKTDAKEEEKKQEEVSSLIEIANSVKEANP